MLAISFQKTKKKLFKGKIKESLDFNLSRQIWQLRKKQLKNKEMLFEKQIKKVEKYTNTWDNNLKKEENLLLANFSTFKGQLANILYNKTKSNAGITNTSTNVIRLNTRK